MKHLIALLIFGSLIALLKADESLSLPDRHVTKSNSGRMQVTADPKNGTQCKDTQNSKVLWSVPQWFRRLFISDDGLYMVTEYEGLNLIPQSYDDKMTMVTFWKNGKILREVTLDELIPNKKILRKTVSHYAWGSIVGFSQDGTLEIKLVNNQRLFYDPKTGKKAGTAEDHSTTRSKSK